MNRDEINLEYWDIVCVNFPDQGPHDEALELYSIDKPLAEPGEWDLFQGDWD